MIFPAKNIYTFYNHDNADMQARPGPGGEINHPGFLFNQLKI